MLLKSTCSSRDNVCVVEPHSMSMAPFMVAGMRVATSTLTQLIFSSVKTQLLLDAVGDALAQVYRIALRPVVVADE